jgi:hypothetical protein
MHIRAILVFAILLAFLALLFLVNRSRVFADPVSSCASVAAAAAVMKAGIDGLTR